MGITVVTKENITCPYCGKKPRLTDSSAIYGRSYGPVYLCVNYPKCNSYVGVHKTDTMDRPLGRMADARLREWKILAHSVFDRYRKAEGISRNSAYKLLSEKLGIKKEEAHIGLFDVDTCEKVCSLFVRTSQGEIIHG